MGVLVVRSSDGRYWLFPKGHVERGESAGEAAAGEVREEAGVAGTVLRFVGRNRYQHGARQVEVSYYLLASDGDVATSSGGFTSSITRTRRPVPDGAQSEATIPDRDAKTGRRR